MSQLPIGVGDQGIQQRFIEENKAFLLEYPALRGLVSKVSLRTLPMPDEPETSRFNELPESDADRVAFENKMNTDRILFALGRVVADDFGEVLVLAGNGLGIGAQKNLRGMYERLVTATYIAKRPAEALPFIEDEAIKKWKLWKRAIEVWPDLKQTTPKESVDALEAEYKRVRATRAETVCKACGQPVTQEAWTRVDMASMAKEVDPNLFDLYGACYLEPTFHSHATSFGLGARFRRTKNGWSYCESSEDEARQAVLLAHNLMLRMLALQNSYFKLGLEQEIKKCADAFPRIWDRQPNKT